MRYRLTSTIPVPIERVFAFSVDPRNTASAHGGGTTITKITDRDIGLGTVFRYDRKGKPGWMVVEITEFDPPYSFVTTARMGRNAPESGRMTFVETAGVTRVSTEADFQLPSWLPDWLRVWATPIAMGLSWPVLMFGTWYGQRLARRALL